MSENVEVVRRAYEVFDTDLDALLGLLDPAIEWISPSDALEPGLRRGHKGVRDAFAATAMAWDEPMSQENLALYDTFNSRDEDALVPLYDPEAKIPSFAMAVEGAPCSWA